MAMTKLKTVGALALALMLASAPARPAHAQWVVIDPANLAQSITQVSHMVEQLRNQVSQIEQAAVTPIYETMSGWKESTRGARSWADLPAEAIKYVKRLEELVESSVTLLSTSPERDDTILVQDPFFG